MLSLTHINFRYKKKRSLFSDLNLELKPGHIYGLLGKNGAGKSSLLKIMCGMQFPQTGSCLYRSEEVAKRQPATLADMYLVPEEFELPAVSIRKYVKAVAPFYPNFSQQQLDAYLAEFELPENESLAGFSYGMKKKFLIAFGLATNVRLLLLDEPTNGLDIPSKSQFRKIVASALDEDRMLVISTHQVRDLENLIDVVVVLDQGRVTFNQDTLAITQGIAFRHDLSDVPADQVLYAEEMGGRSTGLVKNTTGADTRIDLELLFNAVMKKSAELNAHLQTPATYAHE